MDLIALEEEKLENKYKEFLEHHIKLWIIEAHTI